ncbi:hypothetical protein Taro_041509, partial [Colocasia esculenta]|nr:hypothetical protein [Colocasia esculenta]
LISGQERSVYIGELEEALMQGIVGIRANGDRRAFFAARQPPTLEIFPSWPTSFHQASKGNSQSADSTDSGTAHNTSSAHVDSSDSGKASGQPSEQNKKEMGGTTAAPRPGIASPNHHQPQDKRKLTEKNGKPLDAKVYPNLILWLLPSSLSHKQLWLCAGVDTRACPCRQWCAWTDARARACFTRAKRPRFIMRSRSIPVCMCKVRRACEAYVRVRLVVHACMLMGAEAHLLSALSQTLRRLAQNREAARKSRMRKKAYVQQLESSRIKLTQLEQDLQRARSQPQGLFVGGGGVAGGNISSGN